MVEAEKEGVMRAGANKQVLHAPHRLQLGEAAS